MSTYPVAYKQHPPVERNRLTVFFRLFCAIPHLIVGSIYAIGAFFAVFVAWFAILITGRYPQGLYTFVAGVLHFYTRTIGYLYLLTDEFPSFGLSAEPEYPVAISIPAPKAEYNRVLTLFRAVLYIPVYIIAYVFALWLFAVVVVIWFAAVITGRTAPALTEAVRMPMAYTMRSYAYLCLVVEDFPAFDPGPNQLSPGDHQPPLPGGYGGPANGPGPQFVKS